MSTNKSHSNLRFITPVVPPGTLVRLGTVAVHTSIVVIVEGGEFTAGMVGQGVSSIALVFTQQFQFVRFHFVANGKEVVAGVSAVILKVFQCY